MKECLSFLSNFQVPLLLPPNKSFSIFNSKAPPSNKYGRIKAEMEVRVCINRTCKRQGSIQTLEILSGISPPDVYVKSCGCLGRCGAGPNLVILPGAVFVGHCGTAAQAAEFMATLCGGGSLDASKSLDALSLRKRAEDELSKGNFSEAELLLSKTSVRLKLVEGDSAGTVTAFYMSSSGLNHDELDFEFLGNVTGEPYLVQTNVYVNGTGDREQRHTLWFDPTVDFHTYSLFWNHHSIMFLVDEIPIRVFSNKEEKGMPYPKNQAMGIHGSVWNADDWATQGGRVKTDWSHAPFVSSFQSFEIDACELLPETEDAVAQCSAKSGQFWWDKPSLSGLNKHQRHQLKWVRAKHLVYDYCMDTDRFAHLPRECLDLIN